MSFIACAARIRYVLVVLGLLWLSGCAGLRDQVPGDLINGINDELDKWSCPGKGKDDPCLKSYDNAGLRQLRAHVVVSMFARYAAARLPDYSQDLANDAAKMLARIEEAEQALLVARQVDGDLAAPTAANNQRERKALYPVDRVEALIAVVGVADAATRPTRKGLFSLMSVASAADRVLAAPKLLGDALKDLLYVGAYRVSMEDMRKLLTVDQPPGDLGKAWGVVNEDLAAACDLLKGHARLSAHRCVPAAKARGAS